MGAISSSLRPITKEEEVPLYAYIVRCIDASYYVGHTDDLEKRISDHNIGGLSAYTRKRRPVKLVFAEEFHSREEALALARERQLQGWSRAKKEALIAGNWERLRLLSRSATEMRRGAEEARAAASMHSASAGVRSMLR
jgi:predicted GIY-YIG superfamily endonuclease